MNKYTKFSLAGELETTISGKLLYLILMDVIDEKNQVVIPQKKISKALGMSKSTVSRNLRRLEHIGVLKITPTFNEYGGQMPNQYVMKG